MVARKKSAKSHKRDKSGSRDASAAASTRKVTVGTQIAKQIIKGQTGAPGEFRLEDLNEGVLQARLDTLEMELDDYKRKCEGLKKENDWYRTEIESCQQDTAEYVTYLESKKSEKQSAIDSLIDGSKKDFEAFLERKKEKEKANQARIDELKVMIADLEEKIEVKQQEVNGLSDVMAHRARHEAEIASVQKEMQESERQHRVQMQELERTLLEERIKVQKETDTRIREMESAAHEKAHGYLMSHIASLDAENETLSTHLRHIVQQTEHLLAQKQELEQRNKQLARDAMVRSEMVQLRLAKVQDYELRRGRGREKERKLTREGRKNAMVKLARAKEVVQAGLGTTASEGSRPGSSLTTMKAGSKKPGVVAEVIFNTSASQAGQKALAELTVDEADLDWSDEEDDEYL
ncbi:uncharacterized protein EV422DRAFT_508482 [Fimicolochytrium jonesii]|uniref:uncharacterized protein n=1 Tax=Fimicolochytrium jonesii TaxID=1396493 RepID=UPI0022FE66D4|nr:uncharacterized protein EV422DRAFT_508482 [Fimicolochytrium jonesii]KAI8817924.1 hypothetical protein EV422DRAFT_508482 [Fimicolochytrium jonesii]